MQRRKLMAVKRKPKGRSKMKKMAGGGRMTTKGRSKGGVVRRMGGGRMKTKYRSRGGRTR